MTNDELYNALDGVLKSLSICAGNCTVLMKNIKAETLTEEYKIKIINELNSNLRTVFEGGVRHTY